MKVLPTAERATSSRFVVAARHKAAGRPPNGSAPAIATRVRMRSRAPGHETNPASPAGRRRRVGLRVPPAQHREARLHQRHVGGDTRVGPGRRTGEYVLAEKRARLQPRGGGADEAQRVQPGDFPRSLALRLFRRFRCGREQQARAQQHQPRRYHQPVGAALDRHVRRQLSGGGNELVHQIDDRDAAEIEALSLDQVEQQVDRAVEAVEMQHRRRGHTRRGVPVVP